MSSDGLRVAMFGANSNASRQAYWPILIIGVFWMALVAWRPMIFGFYHDDWISVALPLDRSKSLIELLVTDPSRPLYIIVLYALRFFLTDKAVLWQGLLALVHLLNALAIYRLVTCIFTEELVCDRRLVGVFAATLWLAYPWSLGYSAWSIMLLPDIGFLLAIVGVTQVMRQDPKVVAALVLLSLSWLIYESTWLIWLPFSLLFLARTFRFPELRINAWRFLWMSCLLQALFIIANRLISAQSLHGKKLSVNLLSTLSTDAHLFLNQLLPALPGNFLLGICLALILAGVLLNLCRRLVIPMNIFTFFSMFLGLSSSVLIYAAAGYGIEWTGLFSRVTLPISFWLSMIFASLFMLAWSGATIYQKAIALLASLGIIVLLCNSLLQQSRLWANSWQQQQKILTALPQNVVDLVGQHSLLIADIPRGDAPVFTFSAFWDISGAVIPRMSNYSPNQKPYDAFATVMRRGEWRTTWDGKVVRQYWCHSPEALLWGIEAKQVYIWAYPDEYASAIQAPFDIGCSPTK